MPRDYIRDYHLQTAREDAAAWSRLHKLPYVVVETRDGFEARDEPSQGGTYYVNPGTIKERYVDGKRVD